MTPGTKPSKPWGWRSGLARPMSRLPPTGCQTGCWGTPLAVLGTPWSTLVAVSRRSAQLLMISGSLVRLGYALGLLVAPDAMSRARLAPATSNNSYATMTTRAFGAVHTNVSLLSLRSALLDRDMPLLLGLNLGCDLGDLIATLLEWRNGDLPGVAAFGSFAVQSAGMTTWGLALRTL